MHGRSTSRPQPSERALPDGAPAAGRLTSPAGASSPAGGLSPACSPVPARRLPAALPACLNPGALPHLPGGAAVLYLDVDGAVVVRDGPGRHEEIVHVPRCGQPDDASYLVRVLDAVGNRAPVLVGGPVDRTAFEREFVAVGHHPERFVEDSRIAEPDVAALRRRLRELHGHPG